MAEGDELLKITIYDGYDDLWVCGLLSPWEELFFEPYEAWTESGNFSDIFS